MFNLIFYVIHEIKISERDAGMKYQYSELSPAQFETLVIHVCYRLLGLGTETFSDGQMVGAIPVFTEKQNCFQADQNRGAV